MRSSLPRRQHLPHREGKWGTVGLTWRLHRSHAELLPAERDVVLAVIRRSPETWYRCLAVVVMDDHVHALLELGGARTAAQIAGALKSISSREIASVGHRSAPIWQAEYFDRWMKDPAQRVACAKYVVENPRRRWPELTEYRWVLGAGQ